MVYIQYTFYYFSANKKYPLFSILHLKQTETVKEKLLKNIARGTTDPGY